MNPRWIESCRVWEWRLLVLLIYAIPLHEASKNILWGALAVLVLLRSALEKQWVHETKTGWGILLWLAGGAWASCFAIEPYASWKGFWDMVRGAAMLWLVLPQLREDRFRIALLRHLVLSAGLASFFGWVSYFRIVLGENVYAPHVRMTLPSVGHFNQSGVYLAMATVITFIVLFDKRIFSRKWAVYPAAFLTATALLGTTSRAAIGSAALICFIIACKTHSARWVAVRLLAVLMIAAVALAASSTLKDRAFFRGSFSNRVMLWKSAWEVVKTRPWTGVGLNNFKNASLFNPDPLKWGNSDHAHSLYFNTMAQTGIPGTLGLLALLATTGGAIWRCRAAPGVGRLCFYAAGGAWGVIVLAGFSNTTLHHEMSMLFFTVTALAVSALRRSP